MSDYITIPLSKTNKTHMNKYFTIVSNLDSDLAGFSWRIVFIRGIPTYAQGRGKLIHRVILARMLGRELLSTEFVDHIDGNGLNNVRSNLRLANRSQNQANRKTSKKSRSGYKGIQFDKKRNRYRAVITCNGKITRSRYYNTPEEAHEAYCELAKKMFGEFANNGDNPSSQPKSNI